MKWYLKVLKNYATFSGRARRSEFWFYVLFNMIFGIAAIVIDNVLDTTPFKMGYEGSLPYGYIYRIYSLAVFIPGLAVTVRRMHDVGKSGWYMIIPFYDLILALTDGTPGDNEYGENPKEKKPEEYELYNSIMTLLFSAFVTCGIYALLTITKIINDETVKNIIFIISFTACNLYFLTWNISKTEKRNSIESGQ